MNVNKNRLDKLFQQFEKAVNKPSGVTPEPDERGPFGNYAETVKKIKGFSPEELAELIGSTMERLTLLIRGYCSKPRFTQFGKNWQEKDDGGTLSRAKFLSVGIVFGRLLEAKLISPEELAIAVIACANIKDIDKLMDAIWGD